MRRRVVALRPAIDSDIELAVRLCPNNNTSDITFAVTARPDELVMLWAVSKLKDYVAFAWTSKGDLWHTQSPVALVPPWGEYYPRICRHEILAFRLARET